MVLCYKKLSGGQRDGVINIHKLERIELEVNFNIMYYEIYSTIVPMHVPSIEQALNNILYFTLKLYILPKLFIYGTIRTK